MDEKKTSTKSVPKSKLTKTQAIIVMIVGGLMFLLAIVIPGEMGTTAYTIKIIAGVLGMCVALAGAGLRPIEPPKTPKG